MTAASRRTGLIQVFRNQGDSAFRAGLASLFISPALLANQYTYAILQGLQHFRALSLCRLLPVLLYGAAMLVLFITDIGTLLVVTVVWAGTVLVSSMIGLTVAVARLPKPVAHGTPDRRDMLRFGVRALLGSRSPIDNLQLDQAVVGLFLSVSALGYYVAAAAFTNLPRLVAQALGFVAYPHIAPLDGPAARVAVWKLVTAAAVACAAVVGALELLIAFLVPFFFGDAFAPAVPIARILLIGSLLFGIRRVLADSASGAGYPEVGSGAEIASWVALGASLLLLVPGGSLMDVAWAPATSAAVGLATALLLLVVRLGREPQWHRSAALQDTLDTLDEAR